MTSGLRPRTLLSRPRRDAAAVRSQAWRLAFLLALVALLPAPTLAGESSVWTAEQLFALLAKEPNARARFIETRFLTILNEPLISSGTLAFDPPDRLEKRILKPIRENFVLSNNTLTIERPGERARRSFELQRDPVLWAFVEAFRATLAGDLASLERLYNVTFDAISEGWRLHLKPRRAEVRRLVDTIDIRGTGARITSIEIQETGGDRTLMTIVSDPA